MGRIASFVGPINRAIVVLAFHAVDSSDLVVGLNAASSKPSTVSAACARLVHRSDCESRLSCRHALRTRSGPGWRKAAYASAALLQDRVVVISSKGQRMSSGLPRTCTYHNEQLHIPRPSCLSWQSFLAIKRDHINREGLFFESFLTVCAPLRGKLDLRAV